MSVVVSGFSRTILTFVIVVAAAVGVPSGQVTNQPAAAQPKYDLLLRGGHVIDPRNSISAVRDVAIAEGKIAAVGTALNPADALKTVDASGLYVTPGLIDIHTHVYTGTGEPVPTPATTASIPMASPSGSA